MELIELTNSETVLDDKIQITILILRRHALSTPSSQQSRVVPFVIQVHTHGLGASNIIPFFINSSLQLLFTSFLGGKLSRSMSLALAACFVSRWQKNCSCILRRCYWYILWIIWKWRRYLSFSSVNSTSTGATLFMAGPSTQRTMFFDVLTLMIS